VSRTPPSQPLVLRDESKASDDRYNLRSRSRAAPPPDPCEEGKVVHAAYSPRRYVPPLRSGHGTPKPACMVPPPSKPRPHFVPDDIMARRRDRLHQMGYPEDTIDALYRQDLENGLDPLGLVDQLDDDEFEQGVREGFELKAKATAFISGFTQDGYSTEVLEFCANNYMDLDDAAQLFALQHMQAGVDLDELKKLMRKPRKKKKKKKKKKK